MSTKLDEGCPVVKVEKVSLRTLRKGETGVSAANAAQLLNLGVPIVPIV